jgi:hypothetical protein
MISTLLYVGAFIDVLPLVLFKDVKTFVFVDQCPDDLDEHFPDNCVGNHVNQSFETFLSYLTRNIMKTEHRLLSINHQPKDNLVIFHIERLPSKEVFELHYFYSVSFPTDVNPKLNSILPDVTDLYLCGYSPEFLLNKDSNKIPVLMYDEDKPLSKLTTIHTTEICNNNLPNDIRYKYNRVDKKWLPPINHYYEVNVIDEENIIQPLSDYYSDEICLSNMNKPEYQSLMNLFINKKDI